MLSKPSKKTDKELFFIIEEKIRQGNYIFLKHAKQRLRERNISELDVIFILSGKKGYTRKHNKRKDIYEEGLVAEEFKEWKYCIEGCNMDGEKFRIIITFMDNLMPIITVINIT